MTLQVQLVLERQQKETLQARVGELGQRVEALQSQVRGQAGLEVRELLATHVCMQLHSVAFHAVCCHPAVYGCVLIHACFNRGV